MSLLRDVGNVNFSLLQNKQEMALALAHFNFDFLLLSMKLLSNSMVSAPACRSNGKKRPRKDLYILLQGS